LAELLSISLLASHLLRPWLLQIARSRVLKKQ